MRKKKKRIYKNEQKQKQVLKQENTQNNLIHINVIKNYVTTITLLTISKNEIASNREHHRANIFLNCNHILILNCILFPIGAEFLYVLI